MNLVLESMHSFHQSVPIEEIQEEEFEVVKIIEAEPAGIIALQIVTQKGEINRNG